ncbi:MAG: hypothetical protein JXA82_06110 [Sedimentisphaerales bacterium]|nr:hypothetical protein [Sedimentisphaerales bacterium]
MKKKTGQVNSSLSRFLFVDRQTCPTTNKGDDRQKLNPVGQDCLGRLDTPVYAGRTDVSNRNDHTCPTTDKSLTSTVINKKTGAAGQPLPAEGQANRPLQAEPELQPHVNQETRKILDNMINTTGKSFQPSRTNMKERKRKLTEQAKQLLEEG